VAYCNATSSAQLAAQYPASGGTYLYGRERLGPWWGFFAGWAFLVGKTASCAAMALTFAAYTVPSAWQRPAAVVAVLALTAVNYRGITRTAWLTRVIVAVVLLALGLGVLASLAGGDPDPSRLTVGTGGGDVYGVLQSGGLLFFAFAGYARIATLGEEVRDPERTIPRAIPLALGLAVCVYAVVAVTLLLTLGAPRIAEEAAPLAAAVSSGSWDAVAPVVGFGAAAASLGALLALIAGVSRTGLAMAREGDLPRRLSAVHPRYRVPHRAELVLAAAVCLLVLTVDLRGAIGFSSFGVLLYYFVANLAAFTQPAARRRWPRALQVAGAAGCLVLVATLPWTAVVAGISVLAVGALYRAVRLRGSG
jgi:APA family basic amino acid/polyamine antiporter